LDVLFSFFLTPFVIILLSWILIFYFFYRRFRFVSYIKSGDKNTFTCMCVFWGQFSQKNSMYIENSKRKLVRFTQKNACAAYEKP